MTEEQQERLTAMAVRWDRERGTPPGRSGPERAQGVMHAVEVLCGLDEANQIAEAVKADRGGWSRQGPEDER